MPANDPASEPRPDSRRRPQCCCATSADTEQDADGSSIPQALPVGPRPSAATSPDDGHAWDALVLAPSVASAAPDPQPTTVCAVGPNRNCCRPWPARAAAGQAADGRTA